MESLSEFAGVAGRTFVMTGGTGVLGRSIVAALLRWKAQVALLTRSREKGEKICRELGEAAAWLVIECDILNAGSLEGAIEQTLKRFGRIDGLINGAGGNDPKATTGPEQSFLQIPVEALRYVMDLNLIGTILPSQAVGKVFATQKEGVILNVASMSSFRPLTRVVAYSAAKAAVSNFTQWLAVHMAQEYSPLIRVNAIAPGFFLTEQNRYLLTDRETGKLSERGNKIIEHTPMRRFGEPEDLLGAVAWLLSPASAFVTGVVVPIDGGFSAYSGI